MSFFKKFSGEGSKKKSGCCGVEIKEVDNKQEEDSCCESGGSDNSCC